MMALHIGTLKLALMSGLAQLETDAWGLHFEVWTPLLRVGQWDFGIERTKDRHDTVNFWLGPLLFSTWRPLAGNEYTQALSELLDEPAF
jgi:hypothetical protein